MSPSQSILVVDDDDLVRRALERALRSTGYRIFTASGGVEALEVLKEHEVIAVISDHLMPDMTGLELMREVKTLYPKCAKLIITGFMPERVAEALAAGEIDRFMTKPWENSDLRTALQEVLAQKAKKSVVTLPVKTHPAA